MCARGGERYENLGASSKHFPSTVWIGAHKKILAFLHICKAIYPLTQDNLKKIFFGFKKVLKKYCKVWDLNPQCPAYSK